ncbi:N2,N2-dimethylguanosine tRNA methyltransferase [Picosynechococcus sp. NKBG15041c]|uniref:N2,N2-dimethylguanosine tRNA methyltransferase n=1 Tax=Picosynechococcus sp. NKBG15041c TaxID=1407650 RepID=UPI00040CBBF3|nr:N2,N2-dimethylguanosine tRNA methyltransferase [Picosynechococcus sp. NKBG15041c]
MTQLVQERSVQFQVGTGFYRPKSRLVRDLGVLAAAVYQREQGRLQVLDGMSATGVRSLRYFQEAKADWVWANEGNPELLETLTTNLRCIPPDQQFVSALSLRRLCLERQLMGDRYDLVDIDGFGSGAAFVQEALGITTLGGLIYLTSTDGRTYSGREPQRALRKYGAYGRSHPSVQEQGLRLLLGSLAQQAAQRDLGIEPIFSLFWGDTCRVMVRLQPKPNLTAENYGFLGYCHHCGNYGLPSWRKLSQAACDYDQFPLTLSGPMWLGALHNGDYLEEMATIAQRWDWQDVFKILETMQTENELPPYFFPLKEIGARAKIDLPKLDWLLEMLRQQGFSSSRTHINPQAIKTTATMADIQAIAKANPRNENNH